MDLLPYDEQAWAGEFCRIAREKGHHLDIDWVRGWFKNALQRGYDEGVAQAPVPAIGGGGHRQLESDGGSGGGASPRSRNS